MIQANMHEAKTRLSQLIQRAEAGEEVMIARRGKPVVRLQVVRPEDVDGPSAGEVSWADWKAMDREIEAEFERSANAPFPDREPFPKPSAEERARLAALSTEELIAELVERGHR